MDAYDSMENEPPLRTKGKSRGCSRDTWNHLNRKKSSSAGISSIVMSRNVNKYIEMYPCDIEDVKELQNNETDRCKVWANETSLKTSEGKYFRERYDSRVSGTKYTIENHEPTVNINNVVDKNCAYMQQNSSNSPVSSLTVKNRNFSSSNTINSKNISKKNKCVTSSFSEFSSEHHHQLAWPIIDKINDPVKQDECILSVFTDDKCRSVMEDRNFPSKNHNKYKHNTMKQNDNLNDGLDSLQQSYTTLSVDADQRQFTITNDNLSFESEKRSVGQCDYILTQPLNKKHNPVVEQNDCTPSTRADDKESAFEQDNGTKPEDHQHKSIKRYESSSNLPEVEKESSVKQDDSKLNNSIAHNLNNPMVQISCISTNRRLNTDKQVDCALITPLRDRLNSAKRADCIPVISLDHRDDQFKQGNSIFSNVMNSKDKTIKQKFSTSKNEQTLSLHPFIKAEENKTDTSAHGKEKIRTDISEGKKEIRTSRDKSYNKKKCSSGKLKEKHKKRVLKYMKKQTLTVRLEKTIQVPPALFEKCCRKYPHLDIRERRVVFPLRLKEFVIRRRPNEARGTHIWRKSVANTISENRKVDRRLCVRRQNRRHLCNKLKPFHDRRHEYQFPIIPNTKLYDFAELLSTSSSNSAKSHNLKSEHFPLLKQRSIGNVDNSGQIMDHNSIDKHRRAFTEDINLDKAKLKIKEREEKNRLYEESKSQLFHHSNNFFGTQISFDHAKSYRNRMDIDQLILSYPGISQSKLMKNIRKISLLDDLLLDVSMTKIKKEDKGKLKESYIEKMYRQKWQRILNSQIDRKVN